MSVQWSEQPPAEFSPLSFGAFGATSGGTMNGWAPSAPGDGISLSPQPSSGYPSWGSSSSGASMIQQLLSMLAQMLGQMGFGSGSTGSSGGCSGFGGSGGYGGSSGYGGGEQYFSNASGASVGDPHLSFDGGTWNDMSSEPNLLQSNSFRGGYQLSTQTTAPNAQGVTYNQQATVTTHGGNTQVSLENNGTATLTQNGVSTNIAPGQSIQLGNETITRGADGSLQVVVANQSGGQITTTMNVDGQGVNVSVSANNVDLGGAMVNGSSNTWQPGRMTPD